MLLTLVLLVFSLAQAPGGATGDDALQKTLERLEADWNEAHARGDAAALDRLLGDDVVIVVPGMRVMTKADAVEMFTSGRMKFDRYETSETRFRIFDKTAVATGRLRRTRVTGGATVDDDWRFTKVYRQLADRWQVISFHASNTAP